MEYVRGIDNPADIPTRICSDNDLIRWLDGPKILRNLEFSVD